MTDTFSLTKDDIWLCEWNGHVPNGMYVKIYVNNEIGLEKGKQLQQQILSDHEIVKRLRKRIKVKQDIIEESEDTLTQDEVNLELQELKEILGEKE